MQPQFEDEEPINPFDLWSGADFRIKIQTIGGYWNYDKSDFAAPSTLGGFDDEKLEALWKSQHSLKEFTDPSAFKSYEKLEERLNLVLNKGHLRSALVMSKMKQSLTPLLVDSTTVTSRQLHQCHNPTPHPVDSVLRLKS